LARLDTTDIIPAFPPLTSLDLFGLPLIYSLSIMFFRKKKHNGWSLYSDSPNFVFIIAPHGMGKTL
jgi:hypothetical protein